MSAPLAVPFSEETDATYYFAKSDWESKYEHLSCYEKESAIELEEADPTDASIRYRRSGRAYVARCYQGEYYSITVRKGHWQKEASEPQPQAKVVAEQTIRTAAILRSGSTAAHQKPYQSEWDRPLETGKFLIGAEDLVTLLCEHLFPRYRFGESIDPVRGLLVFAGQTGSGKSELLRRFLIRYLRAVKAERKPPHLLTYEEPIESFLWKREDLENWRAANSVLPIDYTPRQRDLDTNSLQDVLNGALRQTPSAVYVGETRNRNDWEQLLQFAGTGHLVVTTSHAGSLTECMDALLKACGATSAAGRSEVASRIFGLVHIRAYRLSNGRTILRSDNELSHVDVKCQLPSLWKRTILGQKLLMSEGLSAITPGFTEDSTSQLFSFGRTHFADRILKASRQGEGVNIDEKRLELLRRCRTWDLAGE